MQCLSNDHRYCRNGILIPLDHINSDTSVSIYHKKKTRSETKDGKLFTAGYSF